MVVSIKDVALKKKVSKDLAITATTPSIMAEIARCLRALPATDEVASGLRVEIACVPDSVEGIRKENFSLNAGAYAAVAAKTGRTRGRSSSGAAHRRIRQKEGIPV